MVRKLTAAEIDAFAGFMGWKGITPEHAAALVSTGVLVEIPPNGNQDYTAYEPTSVGVTVLKFIENPETTEIMDANDFYELSRTVPLDLWIDHLKQNPRPFRSFAKTESNYGYVIEYEGETGQQIIPYTHRLAVRVNLPKREKGVEELQAEIEGLQAVIRALLVFMHLNVQASEDGLIQAQLLTGFLIVEAGYKALAAMKGTSMEGAAREFLKTHRLFDWEGLLAYVEKSTPTV